MSSHLVPVWLFYTVIGLTACQKEGSSNWRVFQLISLRKMSTVLHVSRQTARKAPQGGNNSTYMANDSQYVRAIQTKKKKCSDVAMQLVSYAVHQTRQTK